MLTLSQLKEMMKQMVFHQLREVEQNLVQDIDLKFDFMIKKALPGIKGSEIKIIDESSQMNRHTVSNSSHFNIKYCQTAQVPVQSHYILPVQTP